MLLLMNISEILLLMNIAVNAAPHEYSWNAAPHEYSWNVAHLLKSNQSISCSRLVDYTDLLNKNIFHFEVGRRLTLYGIVTMFVWQSVCQLCVYSMFIWVQMYQQLLEILSTICQNNRQL
jgi:hypothetical protein